MRAVVARLVEIRVAHVEEAAERRAHIRPAAPEAVVPLLGAQVPAGHQLRVECPWAAQPEGKRRRMPHRGHQRLVFRTEALIEERVVSGGGVDLSVEDLGRTAVESGIRQDDRGVGVRAEEVSGVVHAAGGAGRGMNGCGTVGARDGEECAEGTEKPAAVGGRMCRTLTGHATPCLPVGEAHVSEGDCMFTQTVMTALRLLAIRSAEWNSPA